MAKKKILPGIVFFWANNPPVVNEFVSTTVVLSVVLPLRTLVINYESLDNFLFYVAEPVFPGHLPKNTSFPLVKDRELPVKD